MLKKKGVSPPTDEGEMSIDLRSPIKTCMTASKNGIQLDRELSNCYPKNRKEFNVR